MSRICTLYSGSSGNSTYIGSAKSGILIDIGKSFRATKIALEAIDLSFDNIKAVFITHEHIDHIRGLRVFSKYLNIPIFASPETARYIAENELVHEGVEVNTVTNQKIVENMAITAFSVPHDAAQCMGYKICFEDDSSAAVMTDAGYITDDAREILLGCDSVVIESNYDRRMLENGAYPYYLKRRIMSNTGHLSNSDCAEFLPTLIRNGTTRVVLAHLSRENNMPELAVAGALEKLGSQGMVENRDFILKSANRDAPIVPLVF